MVSKLFVCLNDEPAEDDDKLVIIRFGSVPGFREK